MANKILIDDRPGDALIREDMKAGVAITPGELLQQSADDDLDPHGSAGLSAETMWALEQLGEEPPAGTDQIDHDYAAGDRVRAAITRPGVRVNAFLDASSANAVAGQSYLESAGNGNLRVVVADTATAQDERHSLVAVADEDKTSPGSGRTRIVVRSL